MTRWVTHQPYPQQLRLVQFHSTSSMLRLPRTNLIPVLEFVAFGHPVRTWAGSPRNQPLITATMQQIMGSEVRLVLPRNVSQDRQFKLVRLNKILSKQKR